jgi:hypothetical protein
VNSAVARLLMEGKMEEAAKVAIDGFKGKSLILTL